MKNGTLLCDVTMTLIRQDKMETSFFLKQHICFLKKMNINHFYPKMHTAAQISTKRPDRSKAVLLLWFLTVTCSWCLYLYFGSAIMLVTYFVNFRFWEQDVGSDCISSWSLLVFLLCTILNVDISILYEKEISLIQIWNRDICIYIESRYFHL